MLDTFDIDSDSILRKVTKVIKDHNALSDLNKKLFAVAQRCEIELLVKNAVTPILLYPFPNEVEV